MVQVRLRLFASAREAAGRSGAVLEAVTLDDVLAQARVAYGAGFEAVLATARVWINGDDPTDGGTTMLAEDDEVAVLPPVSGG